MMPTAIAWMLSSGTSSSRPLTFALSLLRTTWILFLAIVSVSHGVLCQDKAIKWQGVTWYVRQASTKQGPGNNYWNRTSVRLPEGPTGPLELTVHHTHGRWECAQIYTKSVVKYGTYVFHVEGRPDQWDKNLVLGMFTYPVNGVDQTYEIDVELTRWGQKSGPWNHFTVWKSNLRKPLGTWSRSFGGVLTGTYTTHWFNWQKKFINFGSETGHQTRIDSPANSYASAQMTEAGGPDLRDPCRLHINLWRASEATKMAGSLTVRIHKVMFPPSFKLA